jgi:hypothetical protein
MGKNIDELLLTDKELYKIAISDKQHHEDRRDEINTYYIALLAAIITAIPFIDKVTAITPEGYELYIIRGSLTLISLIGLILAVTWELNLKRTLFYIESLDKIIMELEIKYKQPFITRISFNLIEKKSPGSITRYQQVIPCVFIAIFLGIIIYSLLGVIGPSKYL